MRYATGIRWAFIPVVLLALGLSACTETPTTPDVAVVPSFWGGDGHEEPPYHPPPTGTEGCTPGFWKNHLELWVGVSPSDDFDTTFGVDLFAPDITLGEAVQAKGGGLGKLARHGTAALVSALSPSVGYPLTAAEVIAAVQAGDSESLATYNELGCPL